jgi:uncharacterized membrane protein
MNYQDLFSFWIISISWSIVFIILISIYLYTSTKTKREANSQTKRNPASLAKDQGIIWFLLGLLVFYIISINLGSDIVFAIGNILVEAMLVIYVWKSRKKAD